MNIKEEFCNRNSSKTLPHPNHVKHADRRSTGDRYDTVASYYGTLSHNFKTYYQRRAHVSRSTYHAKLNSMSELHNLNNPTEEDEYRTTYSIEYKFLDLD